MMRTRRRRISATVILIVVAVAVFTPFFSVVLASFRTSDVLTAGLSLRHPGLDNYAFIFFHSDMPMGFLNSLIVCSIATFATVALSAFAAYAFSRISFRGKSALLVSLLSTQLLPAAAIIVPMYQIWGVLHLFNSRVGLGLTYAGFVMAVGILLLRGFFDAVPRELDEAAALDGCGRVRTFFLVLLPTMFPALAALAIFTFFNTWQDFIFAATLINDPSKQTLTVTLYSFEGANTTNWGAIMAGTVMAAVPVVIVFSALQRYFVQSVSGSVKG